jgi:hypothetical protein
VPRFTGVGIHDYPFNSSPAGISPRAGLFLCITGLCRAHVSVALKDAEDFATRRISPQAVRVAWSGRGLQSPRSHTAATDFNPADSARRVFILAANC